jgi:hypothetical protein
MITYRHIPGPIPVPVIGNLWIPGIKHKKMLFNAYAEWREKYGKMYRWFCGAQCVIVVAGARTAGRRGARTGLRGGLGRMRRSRRGGARSGKGQRRQWAARAARARLSPGSGSGGAAAERRPLPDRWAQQAPRPPSHLPLALPAPPSPPPPPRRREVQADLPEELQGDAAPHPALAAAEVGLPEAGDLDPHLLLVSALLARGVYGGVKSTAAGGARQPRLWQQAGGTPAGVAAAASLA